MQSVEVKQRLYDPFKILLKFLYLIAIGVYIYFLLDGLAYYQLSLAERVSHNLHQKLRPAGSSGVEFGIAGFVLFVLMLLYSLRKRNWLIGKIGSLKRWLDMHIFLGIIAPLFILLHANFKASDMIAIAFWSMMIVVFTGVFGRYFYLLVPRNPQGEELSLQEIARANQNYHIELRSTLNLNSDQINRLDILIAQYINHKRGIFRTLLVIAANDIFFSFRIYRLKKRCQHSLKIEEPYLRRVVQLAWWKINLHQRMILLNRTRQALHYWLVLHKSFAMIMYLIVMIHVGIAVWLGYV